VATTALEEASDPRFATTRASLVEAIPTTGRRHQIRRHLKHLAHPIIGDATHGKGPLNRWWAQRLGQQRLWLHAWQLTVPHPDTGERLVFDSGLQWPILPGNAHCQSGDKAGAETDSGPVADWQRLLAMLPWHA
jgi:tRNA pseudouridine65 synthase